MTAPVDAAEERPGAPTAAVRPPAGSPLARQPTPALLVERPVLEANIQTMAKRAGRANVTLWPHAKTHKSLEIARLQRAAGAGGVTVATVTEAEAFADAGFEDILLAYPPVDGWRVARLVAVARQVRLQVAVDTVESLLPFARACEREGVDARYLWEVDCGLHRCGTAPGAETALRVREAVAAAAPLRFAGLMAFAGHAYGAAGVEEIAAIARDEADALKSTARALATAGIEAPVLSIGSTPTAHFIPPEARGMRMRPGNYVFYDATQVALGLVGPESCALTVLASVISRPDDRRVILDAGSKALSSDRLTERARGYGIVVGHPDLLVERLFEEHAIVTSPASIPLAVGDRVRVIPNHACASANLHSSMVVTDSGRIVDVWPVRARGWGEPPAGPAGSDPGQLKLST